ncbi:MAG: Kelch repeat-containing protein [Candidatus Izemoplasmataceae bacterium]
MKFRRSITTAVLLLFMISILLVINQRRTYTLTYRHPSGEVLAEERLRMSESIPTFDGCDESETFQGVYETPMLETVYDRTRMPDRDLTLYVACTDEEGFLKLSSVPESMDGETVSERFATNRQGFVSVGNTLHYIGGVGPHKTDDEGDFSGFEYYSDLHIAYNLEEQSWEKHPDLPAKIGFLDAVEHEGFIYILGGEWIDEDGFLEQEALKYDLEEKTYETVADPPFSFQASNGSVVHDGKIYVFSDTKQTIEDGRPSFETTDETLIYDIDADQWSLGSEAPFKTSGGSAALVGDLIYVYRSASSSRSHFASYNPEDDAWEEDLSQSEFHVSHSSSLNLDGKLILSGGWLTGRGGTSGAIQSYDPETDRWETLTELRDDDDGGIGYVAQYGMNGSLYYLGGESYNDERLYQSHRDVYQFKLEWKQR